jgi:hypothetical protein
MIVVCEIPQYMCLINTDNSGEYRTPGVEMAADSHAGVGSHDTVKDSSGNQPVKVISNQRREKDGSLR